MLFRWCVCCNLVWEEAEVLRSFQRLCVPERVEVFVSWIRTRYWLPSFQPVFGRRETLWSLMFHCHSLREVERPNTHCCSAHARRDITCRSIEMICMTQKTQNIITTILSWRRFLLSCNYVIRAESRHFSIKSFLRVLEKLKVNFWPWKQQLIKQSHPKVYLVQESFSAHRVASLILLIPMILVILWVVHSPQQQVIYPVKHLNIYCIDLYKIWYRYPWG